MRILHLSQYFPPEAGAVQVRALTIARTLEERGYRVTVLTEVPNHPSGIVQPGYGGKLWVRKRLDGIDVIYLWVKTSQVKGFRSRMAFYLSYMLAAVIAGLSLRGRFDVVFANSPPLFVAVAGWIISLLRRTPFVMEVQDLWPESAVVLGELQDPRYIRAAEWVEEKCYRRAKRIVAVTEGIYDRLLARGVPDPKLVLAPNGSNIDIFQPDPVGAADLRADLGLEEKFVAIYAGIHGIAQGLEVLVESARLLKDEPDVCLVFVGEGPKKADLLVLKERYGLANLLMLPGQSLEQMPAYLSMADVSVVPLRKVDLFLGARPTKIFDAWACGRPVVVSVDGEARQVVETVGGGVFVEPEDAEAIAKAIITLRDDPEGRARMGQRGQEAVQKLYSLQAAASIVDETLQSEILGPHQS
jgi:glycosyltransferase involved in cell wall biosynthesis